MTIEFEIDTYKIPSFALPAIVNNDYTGIQDDDEAFVDNLCAWLDEEYGQGNWHVASYSEPFFSRSQEPIFGGIASDVCDVEIAYKLVDLD